MPEIKAPSITLTAIGNNRKITLSKIGIPAILLFHGRNTAEASRQVNDPVRTRFPQTSQLFVASIMDLHIAPRLLRGVVEAFIRDAYEEAVNELPEGWSPEEYLLLFPDWDGKITKSFGFKDTDKVAGVVALDAEGVVIGTYQGKDLVEQTLKFLDQLAL